MSAQTVSVDVSFELAQRINSLAQEIIDRRLLEPGKTYTPREAGLTLEVFVHNAVKGALERQEQCLHEFDRSMMEPSGRARRITN